MIQLSSKKILFMPLLCFLAYFVFSATSISHAASVTDEYSKNGVYTATFPQLTGLKDLNVQDRINQDIQLHVRKFLSDTEDPAPRTAILEYKLHLLSERYMSLELTTYTYSGGAHGMTLVRVLTYDLSTGNPCSFTKLFDFKPSEINTAIFSHCKKNEIPLFDSFEGIETYPGQFYLTGDALPVIVFQQYEIAPYSSGIIRVSLPHTQQ